jgi:hypothetical protein
LPPPTTPETAVKVFLASTTWQLKTTTNQNLTKLSTTLLDEHSRIMMFLEKNETQNEKLMTIANKKQTKTILAHGCFGPLIVFTLLIH